MSTRPPPAKPHDDGLQATTTYGVVLEREVLSSPSSRPKKGGGCRFGWCRRLAGRRCVPPAAEAEAECAVCLEELRAGDVVARLPCSHRFHWSCAVPWVQAVSQCPVCRAHVATGPN
jgi:hypothetical protein